MRILLAFDTDGTFWTDEEKSEYVCGIVDPIKLENKLNKEPGVGCFVVSESPYYPKVPDKTGFFNCNKEDPKHDSRFPIVNDQASRYYNLLKVREDFEKIWGKADICLYIDDQAIWRHDAEKAGFILVEVNQFADMFNVRYT